MKKQEEINKHALTISLIVVSILLVVVALFLLNKGGETEQETKTIPSSISQSEINALNLALNLTYKTKQTYWRVTDEFDNPQPFLDLYTVEKDHVAAFQAIFKQLYIPIPKDSTYKSTKRFLDIDKACDGLKILEQDNLRNYQELLPQVKNQIAIDFLNILIDRTNRNIEELRDCPR